MNAARPEPTCYDIRIAGYLDQHWSDWFGGLTLTPEDGSTRLSGMVVDQAALHGLLAKVRDLGLVLLSVVAVTAEAEDTADGGTRPGAAVAG